MNREEAGNIPNIYSMLTDDEKILRSSVLAKIVALQRPVTPSDMRMDSESMDIDVQATVAALLEKGLIVLGGSGEITGAYPVSALPTGHNVTLKDGRSLYAMCAIDSLGIVHEFNQDATVSSSCKYCGEKIVVEMRDGKISEVTPATAHAIHVDIQKYKNWAASC